MSLPQYLDVLTAGAKSVRFFLPLCGKAGDLLYLYNEGHTVTGVEGVPFVVEQFFRENKLDYEKVSLPEIRGWKYKVEQTELKVGDSHEINIFAFLRKYIVKGSPILILE